MQTPPSDTPAKPNRPRRGRWLVFFAAFVGFAWSLPRPLLHDVVVESANDPTTTAPRGRLAFRTAELLAEFSGKGSLADETELSGPCFADDGQTLYFSRARPGQKADIVLSTLGKEHWSKPESVRELNSVDDDRRLTLTADGRMAVLASNRSGGHGGFDLYESTKDGNRWSRPHNAGASINSDADEFDPALTPDGLTLFFVRVMSGAGAELFVAHREQLDAAWSAPEPVSAVNSPSTHERSPAVSPDGSWLLFASNRGDRTSEPASFGFFRAPLRDGQIGAAERLSDGIASDADDLDATLSPDGRTLAFASKRDGPKQLFLSHGEFVVTRLTISTAHLDRFGQRKWVMPVLGVLLLFLAWRWARRTRVVQVVTETMVPAVAERVIPRRSEPPKNPLASWSNSEPIEIPPAPPKVNPLLASATLPSVTAEMQTEKPSTSPATRSSLRAGRRRAAVALLALVASLAVALQFDFWRISEGLEEISFVDGALWSQIVHFEDIATITSTESAKLNRFDTAQTDAPPSGPVPSVAVALRLGARWPNDRVVVRSHSEVARVADIEPLASQQTRLAVLSRRSIPSDLTRPNLRPAEETTVATVSLAVETPHTLASINASKQVFDPPDAERTSVPPATANRASLPKPSTRMHQPVTLPPVVVSSGIQSLRALARSGVSSRFAEPSGVVEPQDLSGLIVVSPMESPLQQQPVNLSRSETPPVGQPTAADTSAVRSLPAKRNSLVDHFAVMSSLAKASSIEGLNSLARRDVSSRISEPIALAEPQVLTNVIAVNLEESPLPEDSVVMSRSETPPVGQPSATDPLAFQWQPTAVKFVDQFEGPSSDPNASSVQLLSKLPTAINLALLTEESTPLTKDAVTENDNAPAKINPSRTETQGPQPELLATNSISTTINQADMTRLRRPSGIDAATSSDAFALAGSLHTRLSQRVSQTPTIATVLAEAAIETTPAGPAILLTSATMLVELLAPPALPPLPRAELAGPTSSVASEPLSGVAQRFSRTANPTAVDGTISARPVPSLTPVSALPRRERAFVPAELPEELK